jgi:hypothetical protein
VLAAPLLLLCLGAALAQQLPWQKGSAASLTNGADVGPNPASSEPVAYLYPEQVQLTVGQAQTVDLHFRIRPGLHINSHKPTDASFIRTELIVLEPLGFDVEAVSFPPGQPYASKAFPGHELSVYSDMLTLRARILARKPGEAMLDAALRYQACDTDTCFPPKKAPVALDLIAH